MLRTIGALLTLICLALMCFVGAALALKYGGEGLSREYAARSWPKVKGVVKAASVVVSVGRRRTLWCPTWKYHYLITPDLGYASTRTAVGTYSCEKSRQAAEIKLETRRINSVVDVIYDPADPAFSALYVSDDGGLLWWFLLFSGTGFLISGVLSVYAITIIGKQIFNPE